MILLGDHSPCARPQLHASRARNSGATEFSREAISPSISAVRAATPGTVFRLYCRNPRGSSGRDPPRVCRVLVDFTRLAPWRKGLPTMIKRGFGMPSFECLPRARIRSPRAQSLLSSPGLHSIAEFADKPGLVIGKTPTSGKANFCPMMRRAQSDL